MKTFAIIFAWVPVMLAFMGTGQPGIGHYVIWTLCLVASGIVIFPAMAQRASRDSVLRVKHQFLLAFKSARSEADWQQSCRAHDLFVSRGAL